MNSRVRISLLLLLLIGIGQTLHSQTKEERPTVALVLSGGGAKGFAHAGVLQVIDSLDIPIDYIVGTSMGSIIGGMYAVGCSADEMIEEIRKQKWATLFSPVASTKKISIGIKDELSRYNISFPIKDGIKLPRGVIEGQQIINLLSRYTINYHNVTDFAQLPIPYSAVAVDLETGEPTVLEKGFLPQVMRASMAIPSVFTPTKINGKLYIDGGLINNFPADVAKSKGVDYIIGVDVQTGLRSIDKLESLTDVINQIIGIPAKEYNKKNIKLVDVYIKPDVKKYSVGSFDASSIDSIIKKGKEAGNSAINDLIALKQKLGTDVTKKVIPSPIKTTKISFNNVVIKGLDKDRSKLFLKKSRLNETKEIKFTELKTKIEDLSASMNLSMLNYRLKQDTLVFHAQEKNNNSFNIGLHYDSDNNASVLLNTTYYDKLIKGTRWSSDLFLGENLQFTTRYKIPFSNLFEINIKFDAKMFNVDLYEKNTKIINESITFAKFDVSSHIILWDSYSWGIGLREEYVNVSNPIFSDENTQGVKDKGWYTNYYTYIHLNTLDDPNYPSNGSRLNVELKLLHDQKLSEFQKILFVDFENIFSLSSLSTIGISLRGRTFLNDNSFIPYQNFWGGMNKSNYLDYHIPFVGTKWVQGMNTTMAVARLDFRQELFRNNYLIFSGNYGRYSNDEEEIIKNAEQIWGGGITYSYNSLIGPIEATIMHSNVVKKPMIYISIGYKF